MSRILIRKALEKKLNTLTGGWTIQFENVEYKPTPGTNWLKSNIIFSDNAPAGTGANAGTEWNGYIQVTVFTELNKGPSAGDTKAEAIRALFPRGLNLTESGVTVIMLEPTIRNPIEDAHWWALPVLCPFVVQTL